MTGYGVPFIDYSVNNFRVLLCFSGNDKESGRISKSAQQFQNLWSDLRGRPVIKCKRNCSFFTLFMAECGTEKRVPDIDNAPYQNGYVQK